MALCKIYAESTRGQYFADTPDAFVRKPRKDEISKIVAGVDFGGNQSGHAFVATGFCGHGTVIPLMSERIMQRDHADLIDSSVLDRFVCKFIDKVQKSYGNVNELYWDNAETVLGNTIRNAVDDSFPHIIVRPAKKLRIKDRINCTVRLMGAGRFFITGDCESLSKALQDAAWDSRTDERVDDGSSDIDSLDAFEYTIERDIRYLLG